MTEQIEDSDITLQDVLLHLAHARNLYPGGLPLSDMQQAEQRSLTQVPESPAAICWGDATASIAFVAEGTTTSPPFSGAEGELIRAIIEKGMRKSVSEVAVFFEADIQESGLPETASHLILFGTAVPLSVGESGDARGWPATSQLPLGTPVRTDRGVCLVTCSVSEIIAAPERKKEFWQALQQFLVRMHEQEN